MNIITPFQALTNDARELASPESSNTFGLRELWQIFRRRLRLIVAVALIAGGATAATMMLQTPKYTATAVLMVNAGRERVLDEDQALSDVAADSALVDTEIEVLRSLHLAERLAERLHLERSAYWNPVLRDAAQPGDAEPNRAVAQSVADAISVRRQGLSYVIDVSVTSPDARQSALMANTLTELYNDMDEETRAQTGVNASTWLSDRVRELRADVEAKEAAAEQFRAESGLLAAGGVPLGEQQIADVQASVLATRAELASKQAQYELVQRLGADGGSVDTIASALGSEVIRDLRQREVDQARQQAERESTLGELHPTVLAGRAELDNIRGQIRTEMSRIEASVDNDMQVTRSRLRTMEGSLASARHQLSDANGALVRLNQLERDAASARSVYESFLQRYHVIAEQGHLRASPMRLVSQARTPLSPSSPRLALGLVLALTIGLAAGFAAGLLAEMLDDGFANGEDLQRRAGLLMLTSVPLVRKRTLRLLDPHDRHPAGYLVDKPMSSFAEAFRVLRTTIRYSGVSKQSTIVAVTSALADEGKTTCSLSLARACALAGQRTILLDCDLRRCSLNQLLAIEPQVGLLDVLIRGHSWRSIVGRDESTGADVLACAHTKFTPRDVFNTEAMDRLLGELRQNYDIVILDCPPVLAVAEAHELANRADAVVIVSRASKTPARALRAANEQLNRMSARVLGVVLNCSDPRRSPYPVDGYASRYYQE